MPTTTALTNWAGNVSYCATRVHRPDSLDELRRLVGGSERIRAVGSRHSFNRVADTDGELVQLGGLPHVFTLDPDRRRVTVGAGMTYADFVPELNAAGWALANTASLPHISVGGAIATATHGSGRSQQCLAAAVAGLRTVGADGEVREVVREDDADLLAGSVVGLGALGIVTEVTLDVEPRYSVLQRVRTGLEVPEVADQLDDILDSAYSVSVFTDWVSSAHAQLKVRTDRPAGSWSGGREAADPVHPVPGMPTEYCTQQLGEPGWWHERLPHFRAEFMPGAGDELQSEYFVPRDLAAAAFTALAAIGDQVAPVIHCTEIRAVRADDLWLSPAHGRDSVTIHFTWRDDAARVEPVMRAVEGALEPFVARPHWGKLTAMPATRVVEAYPRAADFAALRRRLDPSGTFSNTFVEQHFGA